MKSELSINSHDSIQFFRVPKFRVEMTLWISTQLLVEVPICKTHQSYLNRNRMFEKYSSIFKKSIWSQFWGGYFSKYRSGRDIPCIRFPLPHSTTHPWRWMLPIKHNHEHWRIGWSRSISVWHRKTSPASVSHANWRTWSIGAHSNSHDEEQLPCSTWNVIN